MLRDVYYKSEYKDDVDGYMQIPFFGKGVEDLDNKEVKITGFMLTLSPDEGIFVLSQNPYADCFFCGYGGPESAIELRLKPGYDSFFNGWTSYRHWNSKIKSRRCKQRSLCDGQRGCCQGLRTIISELLFLK